MDIEALETEGVARAWIRHSRHSSMVLSVADLPYRTPIIPSVHRGVVIHNLLKRNNTERSLIFGPRNVPRPVSELLYIIIPLFLLRNALCITSACSIQLIEATSRIYYTSFMVENSLNCLKVETGFKCETDIRTELRTMLRNDGEITYLS